MAIVRPDQSSGGGGGGTVKSVKATDTSIVVAGTATDPTIATGTLDVIAADHPPAADWSNNSHKITGLANGSAATDAAAFGQIPATAGLTQLIYRYTVAGAAKAAIDTGVDAPNAGSNDWTNGDVLEVWIVARTDDGGSAGSLSLTLNNDGGANYDVESVSVNDATVSAAALLTASAFQLLGHGSGGSANYPGIAYLTFPNYGGTTFFKTGTLVQGIQDATAANNFAQLRTLGYRSTAAIARLKVAPATAGKNFVVGTQLLIYKRLAS